MIQETKIMGLLETGMKAEGLRQQAIANNIANLQTNGYRRSDVNFEAALNKAMNASKPVDPDLLDVESYETHNTPINENGSDVSLDSEVGEMVKNSIRHNAYMLLLKKKYQQMDTAMRVV